MNNKEEETARLDDIIKVVRISNQRMNHFRMQIDTSKNENDFDDFFTLENGGVFHNGDLILTKERISNIPTSEMFNMGMNNLRMEYYSYRKNVIESEEPINQDLINLLDWLNSSLSLT
jgi:hypothetical protein